MSEATTRPNRLLLGFALSALALVAAARGDDPPKKSEAEKLPPPVQLTAQQDHKRMMELLNIKELRRGANPRDPKAPNAVNYDESKANPYPKLPDPLTLKNGQSVTTAEVWWKQRRPEIIEDFDREVYGRVPKNTPKVKWEVTATEKQTVGDIPAVTKRLVGHVDNSAYPHIAVDIQLTLTTPVNATGPVPVIMEFGFGGAGRGPAPPPGGGRGGPGWQQQVLARGWGFAVIVPNSIQADNGGGLTRGIIGLCNKGQPRKPDDWGALRAWAWGASRALDYFETDKAVDARRVGIEGLSRYGKAAIVAMAYDDRFAIGFIGSSGAGGAKLHRRNFGELVENVASSGEYHWMAGNYLKYAGPLKWDDLPVDAHELVALCAPRPVFISVGSQQVEGGWVDAKGMFLAGVGAGPVYKLLGKKDLGTAEFPPQETALIDGEIAFRQHAGGHTTGPNWPTFLTFAERYFKDPAERPTEKPPAVLFSENFDDPQLLKRGWYDGSTFTITDTRPYAGKGCIAYSWKADTTNPYSSSGVRRLFEATDTVYLRCHIRLSKGWGWTGRGYHPHLMHFMTTENAKFAGPAASHLTVYIEPWDGKLRLAAQDIQNKERPHGLTQGPLQGGYNGRTYDSKDVLFTDDGWHCVEAMFRLNSLDLKADKPNADGIIRGWFDDKLVVERTDVILRSTDFPSMKFNQFLLLPYFGPGLLPHAQALWIDELAVGTKRLGPMTDK